MSDEHEINETIRETLPPARRRRLYRSTVEKCLRRCVEEADWYNVKGLAAVLEDPSWPSNRPYLRRVK